MKSAQFFKAAQAMIKEQEFDSDMTSTFQFEITKGNDSSVWCIDPANKRIVEGGIDEPTCSFTLSDDDFMKLITKAVQPAELFMAGKLKLDGDIGEAMKFQSVMEEFDVDPAALKAKL
eukprot:CAMPEP_0197051810 /NCGR_PEP_ID=MMETSP1384-20130603/26393_1 /TAXON_ID=29189 /ORGANISM="Ammonia sp." /LENGTH=117 /DNA_ID=CAMNT_0042484417 /DNA_START=25 /DNA_END=378 /DNA_ORIENTATION=+